MTEFPDFFLSRHDMSWFVLAYVLVIVAGATEFTLTRLYKRVLVDMFFQEYGFNFLVMRLRSGADSFILTFKYKT